jgi:hypothetical protein
MGVLFVPVFRAFDSNGNPLAFGKVYTYEAGTSTPKPTYTTSSLSIENTNPVILDAEGSAPIWLSGTYKIDLFDQNDVQQNDYPIDNISNEPGATGPAGTFQMATAGGTVDAITADYSPNVTLSNLTTVGFVALGANTSTTPTFAPDGLTARTITKKGGVALRAGDIPGALAACLLEYNSANTRWELLNPGSETFGTEQSIASATTTNLGTLSTNTALITGTTTITGFGNAASTTQPIYFIRFSGVLTLTHNGTSLIIPGSTNITTANGDTAIVQYLGASNWKVLQYTRVSGLPIVNPTVSASARISSTTYTTNTTLSTTIPYDDTIPQNTEGTEILSLAFTPTNASSTLIIDWKIAGSGGSGSGVSMAALFVDSTANALNTVANYPATAAVPTPLAGKYVVSAGSTSARTYKIRVGTQSGSYFPNGDGGASRKFGGTSICILTVTEILP